MYILGSSFSNQKSALGGTEQRAGQVGLYGQPVYKTGQVGSWSTDDPLTKWTGSGFLYVTK